ncbi:MAG: choice-of-anchor J domain-containing protein [Bacteroidia bacterium]|nr:choice-of-anchor J domain-containing protein [Bacteroidia bacterium]
MKKIVYCFVLVALLINVSCKKKFDLPPVKDPPAMSGYIKIDSIRKCYEDYYLSGGPQQTKWYKFLGDVNLECTVTADEESGNIYKTVYVEDATGALQVKLLNAGGLAVGDKIRINLNGVILNDYGSMVQLDSVDIEKRVVKLSTGNPVVPTKVSINQLLSFDVNGHTPFQSRLVIIDSVEFTPGNKNKPFADAIGKNSIDRYISGTSCGSPLVSVRSSGYSNFASNLTPCGKGTMTLIVSQYNSDLQFTIRDFNEVKLTSGGCPIIMADFDEDIFKGGWINYNVTGNVNWVSGTYSGRKYAEISNYINFANQACETWFISPSMNIAAAASPRLSFESAYNFSGPTLEVYVSTNYSSGNPNAATWVNLNPTLSGGSYNWVNSCNISLNSYKSANTRIAFKYTGTATSGSRWEIDDVAVFGE